MEYIKHWSVISTPHFFQPAPPPPLRPLIWPQIKWLIRGSKEGGSLRVQERFIAGSLAGATAQTIIYPMEVSSTRVVLSSGCQRSGGGQRGLPSKRELPRLHQCGCVWRGESKSCSTNNKKQHKSVWVNDKCNHKLLIFYVYEQETIWNTVNKQKSWPGLQ